MALIDPVLGTAMQVPPLDAYGYADFPNVQPFSQRAASGYQDQLEAILKYLTKSLYPYLVQTNQQEVWDANVTALIHAVEDTLTAQTTDNAQQIANAITSILESSITITDPAILVVLQSASSATRGWIAANVVTEDHVLAALADPAPIVPVLSPVARLSPVPGSRSNTWNARLHLYNEESPSMTKLRRGIARAPREGTFQLACIGDSKFAGFGTNNGGPIREVDSLPGQLRALLGAGEGMSFTNTFHGAGNGGIDLRWSAFTGLTRDPGKVDGQGLYLRNNPGTVGPMSATFTQQETSDGVSVFVWGAQAPVVTVTIDGVAKAPVTITDATQWTKIDYASLSVAKHTVKVDATLSGTQSLALLGVKSYLLDQPLTVANAGICSAVAGLWKPSADFTDAFQALLATGYNGAIVQLGTNPSATTIADLTTVCNQLTGPLGAGVLLVSPGTLDPSYSTLRDSLYGVADALNLPLLDLQDVTGWHAEAAGRDLIFDGLHENGGGYTVEAAAVAAVLRG